MANIPSVHIMDTGITALTHDTRLMTAQIISLPLGNDNKSIYLSIMTNPWVNRDLSTQTSLCS